MEMGNAYRWSAKTPRDADVARKLITEAAETLPPETRYELRRMPDELGGTGVEAAMCWYRHPDMDNEPDWLDGCTVIRDGYKVTYLIA